MHVKGKARLFINVILLAVGNIFSLYRYMNKHFRCLAVGDREFSFILCVLDCRYDEGLIHVKKK